MFGFTRIEAQTYLILSVAGGLQLFINQIEQPYARSLVVCDVPINITAGAEPSGSSTCGDRLRVIGEGALLSGGGESLESVGRFLITLFVSGFADARGRKAAAVVGWALITASVAAFFLASFVRPWARVLFIVAQGLQGMSGIGLILDIVTRDIAASMAGDTTGFFARKNMFGMLMGMVFFCMVLYIQHSQITEFRSVWGIILLATIVVMLLLVFVFPETQADENRKKIGSSSVLGMVQDEVSTYVRIIKNNRFIKLSIVEAMFGIAAGGFAGILTPWIMAVFGFSQFQIMMMLLPQVILSLFCQPIIPFACSKYGHRSVFRFAYWADRAIDVMCLPLLTSSFGGFPFPVLFAYLKTPFVGAGSVMESISSKLVSPQESAKYSAIVQLNMFFVGSMSSLMFSRIFNSEATTLVGKISPFILSSSLKLCGVLVYLYGWGQLTLEACDAISADVAKEAEEKEKLEGDKKTD